MAFERFAGDALRGVLDLPRQLFGDIAGDLLGGTQRAGTPAAQPVQPQPPQQARLTQPLWAETQGAGTQGARTQGAQPTAPQAAGSGSGGEKGMTLYDLPSAMRYLSDYSKRQGLNQLRFSENSVLSPGKKIGGHASNSYHYAKDEHGENPYAVDIGLTGLSADRKHNWDSVGIDVYQGEIAKITNRFRELGFGTKGEALGPDQDPGGHGGQNSHVHLAFEGLRPMDDDAAHYLLTGRTPDGGTTAPWKFLG